MGCFKRFWRLNDNGGLSGYGSCFWCPTKPIWWWFVRFKTKDRKKEEKKVWNHFDQISSLMASLDLKFFIIFSIFESLTFERLTGSKYFVKYTFFLVYFTWEQLEPLLTIYKEKIKQNTNVLDDDANCSLAWLCDVMIAGSLIQIICWPFAVVRFNSFYHHSWGYVTRTILWQKETFS